ncbi:MAG: Unknown protein [uncultured Thiotrichaceae bacterium]|uniref:Uncharacterized protein n=1 Tax=uncultured Thiotrichaceae bacterium TaxID=298394 RepID=A0A6S6T3J6_9GAMM|nr:MAG: Unknown protein [uncultured Thiotrichaceae bacterium]
MLEYLFFNQTFCDEFTSALSSKNIEFHIERESIQNAFNVNVPENIDDDVWDEIDDIYDNISTKDAKMLQDNLDDDEKVNTAGIYIQLTNNQQTIAKVDPDVMNRMLSVISMDEFNDFIEVIVSSVEEPDDSPICKQ